MVRHTYREMKNELFTSAYQRIRARLIARARAIVVSDDEAKDVIQDAFCNLWSRNPKVEQETQAEALFTTAVKNLSIDVVRRRNTRKTTTLEDNLEMPDTTDEEWQETYDRVERIAALHLSERDRMILFRRDRDEWSFEDIAESYGTTPANARVIVARARKTIRNIYLGNYKKRTP